MILTKRQCKLLHIFCKLPARSQGGKRIWRHKISLHGLARECLQIFPTTECNQEKPPTPWRAPAVTNRSQFPPKSGP